MRPAHPSIMARGALVLIAGAALACLIAAAPADGAVDRFEAPLPSVRLGPSFAEAISQLEGLGGLSVRVDWPALATAGVRPATRASVSAQAVSPAQALGLLLSRVSTAAGPLAWCRTDGAVVVSTQLRVLQNRRELNALASGPQAPPPAADQFAADRQVTQRPYSPARAPATSQPAMARPTLGQGAPYLAAPTTAPAVKAAPAVYSFNEMPLSEVVDFFRQVLQANVFVNWRSLEPLGVTQATAVSLELRGVSPGKALDLVLAQLTTATDPLQQIWWVLDEGIVTIASGEAMDRQMRTQVVDVTDIVTVQPYRDFSEFPVEGPGGSLNSSGTSTGAGGNTAARSTGSSRSGSSVGVSNVSRGAGAGLSYGSSSRAGGGEGGGQTGSRLDRMDQAGQSLVDMIRGSIPEQMWQPIGKGSIAYYQNKLVITQSLLGFKMLEQATRR